MGTMRIRPLARPMGGSRRPLIRRCALGALFLAIFGEFVLHPMIEAAKAGEPTALSFGVLHGVSSALYWLRTVLVGSLAWRLTAAHQPDQHAQAA